MFFSMNRLVINCPRSIEEVQCSKPREEAPERRMGMEHGSQLVRCEAEFDELFFCCTRLIEKVSCSKWSVEAPERERVR